MSSPFLHAITCTKCGAALDPGSREQILVCPYCQTSHVFAPPPPQAPITARHRGPTLALIAVAGVVLLGLAGAGLAWRSPAPVERPTAEAGDEDHGPGDEKLVYTAEQLVDIWHVGSWYPGRIRTVKGGRYFITYDGYAEGWDEWVSARRLRARTTPAPTSAPEAVRAGANPGDPLATYTAGESVDIHWGSRWWPGRVLKKDGARYRITYDGWNSSWDEWVEADRLRRRAAAE